MVIKSIKFKHQIIYSFLRLIIILQFIFIQFNVVIHELILIFFPYLSFHQLTFYHIMDWLKLNINKYYLLVHLKLNLIMVTVLFIVIMELKHFTFINLN